MKKLKQKISYILSRKEKKRFLFLIGLTLIGMILESLGLGLLVPTISMVINPNFFKGIVENFGISFFENFSYQTSLLIILSCIGCLYIFKTIFLTVILDWQNKFIFHLQANISKDLYQRYLNQPYQFYLSTNTSDVTKNILIEVQLLVKYFIALINLFNEGLLLTTIFFTLLIIEPAGVIGTGAIFLIFGYSFFKITNARIHTYGQERKKYDASISRLILEGYGGSKEIKLLDRSSYFIDQFNFYSDQKKRIAANQSTFTQVPRLYIELLAVLSVVGLVAIMLFQEYPTEEVISKVGVFVVAVFRIIPSYSKISAALQNLKFNSVVLDIIYQKLRELKIEEISDEVKVEFKKEIKFDSVFFRYSNSEKNVLNNIDFTIKKGRTIGFIGVSGSGKSTIIDLLNGLLKPNAGQIRIDNIPLEKCLKSWQQKIGYVPQQNFLTDSSIASNIAFGLPEEEIDQIKLSNAIQKAELKKFIDSLPEGVQTKVGERGLQISGGQMQRIGIARALYDDPEVLIFDEATSALDEKTEINVLSAIRELKKSKTIIVITHRKNALKDCDKVYKLDGGVLEEFNTKIFIET